MNQTGRAVLCVGISIALILFGTFGYMIVEGWCFLDGMYMTLITLSTIGYGEVHEISHNGRIFTIVLIIMGVGLFLYVTGNLIRFFVEGQIREILGRKKLDRQIRKLKNHFIICGFGRMGQALFDFLSQQYLDIVVIEQDETKVSLMNDEGVLYLVGPAGDEKILVRAGIERAKGLISVVGNEADNVFIILTAKQMNPDVFLIARADQNSTKKTLMAAGAHRVVSPYELGARRMAHAILRPTVIRFLELAFADADTDILVEEVLIHPTCALIDKKLKDTNLRKELDLLILSIKKADDTMVFNPGADTVIEANDVIVVAGRAKSIQKLSRFANPI